MGDTELSEYNSRRAVGYFLAGFSTAVASKASVAARLSPGQSVMLDTGIKIARVNQTQYQATNLKRRWAAAMSPPDGAAYLLSPRDALVETNVFLAIKRAWQLHDGEFSLYDHTDLFPLSSGSIDTYGSVIRMFALSPALTPLMLERARDALDADAALFARLNAIDLTFLLLDGLRNLGVVVPIGCWDAALSGTIDHIESGFANSLDKDALAQDFAEAALYDVAQGATICSCQASGIGTAPCTVADGLFGIIVAGNWVVDAVVLGAFDSYNSYARIDGLDFSEPRPIAYAGPDQSVIDDDCDGIALVVLSAAGSYDPGNSTILYEWATPTETEALGAESSIEAALAVGEHYITLTITRAGDGETASDSVLITVVPAADCVDPDLTVDRIVFVGGGRTVTVRDGDTASLDATLDYSWTVYTKNIGSTSAEPSYTHAGWKDGANNCEVFPVQYLLGNDSVPTLSAGTEASDGGNWLWGTDYIGVHSLVARADRDGDVDEGTAGETNNDFCATVNVTGPTLDPDLIVDRIVFVGGGETVTVRHGDTTALDATENYTWTIYTKNIGDSSAASSYTHAGWKDGAGSCTVLPVQYHLGNDSVPTLIAGTEASDGGNWLWGVDFVGTYSLVARADRDGDVDEGAAGEANNDFCATVEVTP